MDFGVVDSLEAGSVNFGPLDTDGDDPASVVVDTGHSGTGGVDLIEVGDPGELIFGEAEASEGPMVLDQVSSEMLGNVTRFRPEFFLGVFPRVDIANSGFGDVLGDGIAFELVVVNPPFAWWDLSASCEDSCPIVIEGTLVFGCVVGENRGRK